MMKTLIIYLQIVEPLGVFEQFANYGALGLITLALGLVVYKMWKKDIEEKNRVIKRLEELNDEIRRGKYK